MYYEKLTDLGIKLFRHSGSEKTKCPQCCDGRKNKTDKPLSVNITTGEYNCHHCGWKGNVRSFERKRDTKKYEKPSTDVLRNIELKQKVVEWFASRGISQKTLDKFMIFCKEEWMPQTQQKENCICFPYFRDGEIVNIKYRDAHKNFKLFKDAELIFYNLSSVGDKKYCILTEGEIDCMSAYEAGYGCDQISGDDGVVQNEQYCKWATVSVPNGAPPVPQDGRPYMPSLEYLDTCSDWFIGLHEIVIATDNDEPGNLLKDELIRRLGIERCKVISYPLEEVVPKKEGGKRRCKDLNEVLQYLGKEVVINCIENAEFIPVDGVYYLEDIFLSMLQNFRSGILLGATTRFGEMDDYFRWKKGEVNLITGYGNHGKTFFALQLKLTKSIYDGWKWAVFSPENYPANDFYDDMIEMYAGKWLNDMTEDEYVDACSFIDKHFFYVYPDDAHDILSINEKFRHLVLKKGIDGVLVDPYNQLDHLQKPYQREDQYLSEILKDVKRFALLNNISYNIIAHPKNPSYNQDKSLPVVDMYDIAGGAMWGNKADNILSYYRPNFHKDKNSPEVDIYVQKIKRKRTGGQLGRFSLTLNWGRKRFTNSIGQMPCDPWRAKYMEEKSKEDYTQKHFDGFQPIDGEEF